MDEQDGPVVRPDELQEAGAACSAAALAVPVTAPAAAVRDMAVLPAGRAGPAAAGLADRWEAAIALWCADLVAHGEALGAAAAAYRTGDEDAAGDLTALGSRP
ncbi:hypothetical protein Acsp06_26140 [Actinomycetospora sp. NBRC 106375]|uniref:hypothetical protein n=1 Tax=Actinomycetospora sp. NBRC 106375 TaxID=3032207 RepID=UPI0024A4E6D3|nr:hypothetical protein [Actinomycetospora sp. NBRC 106375]GLZ46429.1 hypothetical protein Acsp06_26140 [Actinomycetospora sp. NBRC 106375]